MIPTGRGWRPLTIAAGAALTAIALPGALALAQQSVPANPAGIPIAPTGVADNPLPDGPFTYRTAEGMDIRVEVVTRLAYPMAMAFLPDGAMLIVTRTGELHHLAAGANETTLVPGAPPGVFSGESGAAGAAHAYVDVVLHPDFATNRLVYLSYNKPQGDGGRQLTLGRGRLVDGRLEGFADIWEAPPGLGGLMTLAFAPDGTLFASTSGADPQNLSTAGGKVLRLNDDGSIPDDNPFIGTAGARPDIYSYGHRSPLGIAIHPGTGALWESENGPNGGDELNIIRPGANYGWPIVSLGRTYQGPWQAERPRHDIFEPPVVYWMPAIAVSGLLFYTGDALPAWKGDVFVGALRTGEIPGTGHLERILFNENMEELRREILLWDLHQRIRDVQQGPEGFIYLATDEQDGAILRIVPAE
jgi:glucose/arabinose dehydrogenase